MATIVLSAAGMAAGSYLGGSILGLSNAVIGRAIGATLGRIIDQKIMGSGSEVVESGRLDRFRLTGASEGAPVSEMYGRMRVPGQVIWATRFQERVTTGGSGKGLAPKGPKTREYTYSVSMAVALCEGEISGIGRIWADGKPVETADLSLRVYTGSADQFPDPKIEAVEGAGQVPAYRGLAYVVFEDLELGPYGNRIPQLTFEVIRPAPFDLPGHAGEPAEVVQGVSLVPGTGEYALATTPVHYKAGPGENRSANVNSASGKSDFATSLDGLAAELPNCASVSMVVSWFGSDLRCALCDVQPKVEQKAEDGAPMAWWSGGVDRDGAAEIEQVDGRPVYGGTPADASVIEGIAALRDAGQAVTFYPFILMEQLEGNGLADPHTGADDQPVLPWRGRITLSVAPGRDGSPDKTAAADAEVAAFFGTAAVADFDTSPDGHIAYNGPAEWSYRRFILHYAHLCAKAGGVDAFCIGSEMRSLTQIRGAGGGFPAVAALRALAADVRAILGPECRIGYAADWSEYFGYHPQDGSGDVLFHLDPLWADDEIDFIGIDNYMPLSDWREGEDHADAGWGSIHDLDYLRANIEGGEGYDWYYDSARGRDAQRRLPISDGAHGQDWVFRVKDIRGWWENQHRDRLDGVAGNIAPIYGKLKSVYYGAYGAIIDEDHTSDDRGYPAVRARFGVYSYIHSAFMTLSTDRTYTLRVRAKSNTGADQVTQLNYHDGKHNRTAFNLSQDWTDISITFVPNQPNVLIFPADPRGGGNATDILISHVSLEEHELATDWVPQSKPVWFTELGCAAIDKGTNQPNKFLDPKSSESALPHYSTGRRDDFIQMQYLRAMYSHWNDPARNPVSVEYGAPMIDMARAHVWAWDARPYPQFPGSPDLWSDGENYARGHWLNGRGSARSLAGVVAEICEASGVTDYDVSRLHGVVRGYARTESGTARAALQPLMLAYGFDAIERNGTLVFQSRDGRSVAVLETERLVAGENGALETIRAPEAEVAGRLRLNYVEADGEFAARAAETVFPDEATHGVAQSELPLVLTRTEADGIAERWLAESRVARDSAKFALPPSRLRLRAGDVVTLPDTDGVQDYRIERVEQAEFQMVEAVRVEPGIYEPSDAVDAVVRARAFVAPVPVHPLFLDLPLLRGTEEPHAPHVAATARPWPGSVAVYSSPMDEGYALNRLLSTASVVGVTETPLHAARPGLVDRGAPLRVRLVSGALASASLAQVLNGANALAIGDATPGNWEVLQFTEAVLVADRTYDLSGRLRGQAGSDGIMPDVWPAGSSVVLLDGAPEQIELAPSARGLARHYRIGPAQRGYDDPSFTHLVAAFDGIGLRPYAPAHLRAVASGGDLAVGWIRRTRIDGDSWQSVEVPLGEADETYLVRVFDGPALRREVTVGAPSWTYTAAARAADGVTAPFEIAVAQVSDRFGPGPFTRITIND